MEDDRYHQMGRTTVGSGGVQCTQYYTAPSGASYLFLDRIRRNS